MTELAEHPMAVRPKPRLWNATTALDHFAIISYVVDPAQLDSLLPDGMLAERFDISGGSSSLVSAVAFLDRDFCFRGFPWIRLSCGQINYRAYVRYRGQPGVWFFGTSLDSWLVAVPRWLWAMPWHRDVVRIDTVPTSDGYERWVLHATGDWGRAHAELVDATVPADFSWLGSSEARSAIVYPAVGWYRRRDGRIGRYSVWHEPLVLLDATVSSARFSVFEDLGLTTATSRPISASLQATTTFDVHTPPRKLKA